MLRQVGTLTYPARYTPGVRQGNKERHGFGDGGASRQPAERGAAPWSARESPGQGFPRGQA